MLTGTHHRLTVQVQYGCQTDINGKACDGRDPWCFVEDPACIGVLTSEDPPKGWIKCNPNYSLGN